MSGIMSAYEWPGAASTAPALKTIRWRDHLMPKGIPGRVVCSVEGCHEQVKGRGWCGTHYARWSDHGDVLAGVPVGELPRVRFRGRTHGKPSTYYGGCRCGICIAVGRVYRKARREAQRLADPAGFKAAAKALYAKNRTKHLEAKLVSAYGINRADWDALNESQGGVCAACGSPPGAKRLNVDHHHATGVIRGLLCNACNHSLGLLKEDEDRILALLAYLRRSRLAVRGVA